MRPIAILLIVLAFGCRPERLQWTFDSKCFQPCYGGNTANAGKGICSMGSWSCPTPESEPVCKNWRGPGVEECNGVDDDCDGVVDEVVDACRTMCSFGVRTCKAGEWTECMGVAPKPEKCNGLDDDCDGTIDEVEELPVEPCYTGKNSELTQPFADCHPGIYKCEAGQKVCYNEKLPSTETCDSKDNNCNGIVDEDIGGCFNGKASQGIEVRASWDRVNDIDLHVLHPDAGNSHKLIHWAGAVNGPDCYFGNKNPNWDNPELIDDNPTLNRDVIQGTGAEAITMTQPVIGHKYTIGVYSFNHAAAPYTVNTSIKVFCNGVLVANQAHGFTRLGEMWVVGTIQYVNPTQCIFTYDGHVMP